MRLSFKLLALSVLLASLKNAPYANELSDDYPPPPTWCIRLKVVYNNGFYKMVGEDREAANKAINQLISGTNEVLTLPGLSYAIKLRLVKVVHEQSPQADAWLPNWSEANKDTLKKMHSNDTDVTLTLVLTDKFHQSGQRIRYGVYAAPKTICNYKNEPKNVLQAIVFAHRLDVDQSRDLAYFVARMIGFQDDSWIEQNEKKTCNGGQGAVMTPRGPKPTLWTSCSNDHMLALYQYYVAIRKSIYQEDPPLFCLSNDCGSSTNKRQCPPESHQVVNTASADIDEAKVLFKKEKDEYLNWLARRRAVLWPYSGGLTKPGTN